MTLEFVLEDEGFEIVMAEDGEQALALAREHLPDCILLDHIMPKVDGREVYAALRSEAATASIPVLVLSGMSREMEGWEGASFVGKPFSPDDLVAQIREAVGEG